MGPRGCAPSLSRRLVPTASSSGCPAAGRERPNPAPSRRSLTQPAALLETAREPPGMHPASVPYENKPRAQTKEESAPAVRRNARPKHSAGAAPGGGSGLPAPPAAPLRTAPPPTNAYGPKSGAKRFSTRPKQEAHPPARSRNPGCTFTNTELRFRRRRCRPAPTARAPLPPPAPASLQHRSSGPGSNSLPGRPGGRRRRQQTRQQRPTPAGQEALDPRGRGHDPPRSPAPARLGWGRVGSGQLGLAWLRWEGSVRRGVARLGKVRLDTARLSTVCNGSAWLGTVQHSSARFGSAWRSSAQLCKVWLDTAWHGLAWLLVAQLSVVSHGSARLSMVRHSLAWLRVDAHSSAWPSRAQCGLAQLSST